jgi:hypothetical protein
MTFLRQRSKPNKPHRSSPRNPFLRSVGLDLPFILGFGRGDEEPPKAVIRRSRGLAFCRCAVHILPVCVSATIITLNLYHYYAGRTLTGSILNVSINIALLQIAAKAQEMLIIGSVSSMVIDVIRTELINGEGVALGTISGGFMFTSLSYFWSPEFWGSFLARSSRLARFRLYGCLVLGGLFATLAGPSCAVLIIPRDQTWPAGNANFFVRGTPDGYWPTHLNLSLQGDQSICNSPNATEYAACPSGGYPSMWSSRDGLFLYGKPAVPENYHRNITSDIIFGGKSVYLSNNFQLLPASQYYGNFRGYACETSLLGIHNAEAMFHTQLRHDWLLEAYSIPYNPLTKEAEYKYYGSLSTNSNSRLPASRVYCSQAQNISRTGITIDFPIIRADGCGISTKNFTAPSLNRTPSSHIRTSWTSLPSDFGTVSAGFIFEGPWDATGSSRLVLGCSIDARWTNGTVTTSDMIPGTTQVDSAAEAFASGHIPQHDTTLRGKTEYSEFRPIRLSPTSYQINIHQSWLDMLTPPVPERGPGAYSWNPNTLESLLTDLRFANDLSSQSNTATEIWNTDIPGQVNRTVALEWILAITITDGLSREGSVRVLNTSGSVSTWKLLDYDKTPDFHRQIFNHGNILQRPNISQLIEERAEIVITGYSFKASAITDYLSISLLSLYILLAVTHTTHLVYQAQSSGCWDTLTELMALMHNSHPTRKALHNTSGGINQLKTYSQVAAIRAVEYSHSHGTTTHDVELMFPDDEDNDNNNNNEASIELTDFPDDWSSNASRISTWPLLARESCVPVASSVHARTSSKSSAEQTLGVSGRDARSNSRGREDRPVVASTVRPDVCYGAC